MTRPSRPTPPPASCDTDEEQRAAWKDIQRDIDRAEYDRPQKGEE